MMLARTLFLFALAALIPPQALAQQASSRSPHGTLSPNLDCTACHTVDGWKPVLRSFDHDSATAFPLVGSHRELRCVLCHLDGRFDEPKLEATDCAQCHFDVHRGELSANCVQCHNTGRFRDVPQLSLHQRTSFPLTGAHVQLSCETCHPGDERGVFRPLATTCISCHESDYSTAQPIDHVAAGFPSTCEQCHSTLAWTHDVVFDHVTVSGGFPLLGRHAEIRCESCHDPATLQPIYPTRDQNDCYTCHDADYRREHAGGGFPTDCAACHTTSGWEGATFDHSLVAPGFQLVGAHETLPCSSCHNPSDMTLIHQPADQDDCAACHTDDYQTNHAGTGFPTTCLTCHNVDSWSGASFANHDGQFFPIYSGTHKGKWTNCQTCHTSPSDFLTFSCFACHEHDQTKMNEKHREVSGYAYESSRCYSCHPNGKN